MFSYPKDFSKKVFLTTAAGLFVLLLILCIFTRQETLAFVLAQKEDVERLKDDLRSGRLRAGEHTMEYVRRIYGEPPTITYEEYSCTYTYPGLEMNFIRYKIFNKWDIDRSQRAINSQKIADLAKKLQAESAIVSGGTRIQDIVSEFGVPTRIRYEPLGPVAEESPTIIAYYGQFRLFFDQRIVLDKWAAQNIPEHKAAGVLTAGQKEKKEPTHQITP